MSFVPKTQPFRGSINAVTLGTGDKAVVIGGQNVLPFYTFDAPIENAPKVGVEISDLAAQWDVPGLVDFYAGCTTMAERAKKAETMEGADFICLNFEGADPNGANRPVEDCVADAKAVAEVVTMPIVSWAARTWRRTAHCSPALLTLCRARTSWSCPLRMRTTRPSVLPLHWLTARRWALRLLTTSTWLSS